MKVKLLKQFGIHPEGSEIEAHTVLARHLARRGFIDLELEKLENKVEKKNKK